VAEVSGGFARPGARTLLGDGVFIMTIDQGADTERYQGVTPIAGETLALSAEHYFAQSEQVPTRVRLAVAQVQSTGAPAWRAGGLILQNIAGDEARGPTEDAWDTAQAFIATLGEDELVDPTITPERLLYRLFHETGVRMFQPSPLSAFCRCSQDRIEGVLKSFPEAERADMVEADGTIRVTCEYCSRTYAIEPADVAR
jgi:molecular chaperone Hsp33